MGYAIQKAPKKSFRRTSRSSGKSALGNFFPPKIKVQNTRRQSRCHYKVDYVRWLGRDLIGEAGRIRLYGFVWNKPIKLADGFGLTLLGGTSFMGEKTLGIYAGGSIGRFTKSEKK